MSLTEMKLESNSKIRIDFGGGNLSSDGGLLLMKEFLSKIGFERLAAAKFKTSDGAKRFHWVKYFYAVFFRKFEIALYDVGSQREFERISFKTLSFMVAFPFSAKRKMTL